MFWAKSRSTWANLSQTIEYGQENHKNLTKKTQIQAK